MVQDDTLHPTDRHLMTKEHNACSAVAFSCQVPFTLNPLSERTDRQRPGRFSTAGWGSGGLRAQLDVSRRLVKVEGAFPTRMRPPTTVWDPCGRRPATILPQRRG